jgi:hypothetical protein
VRSIRIPGGIFAFFAFIVFLFRVRIPESILWLTYQGKSATTKQLLRRTYGIELPDAPGMDIELRRVARNLRRAFNI